MCVSSYNGGLDEPEKTHAALTLHELSFKLVPSEARLLQGFASRVPVAGAGARRGAALLPGRHVPADLPVPAGGTDRGARLATRGWLRVVPIAGIRRVGTARCRPFSLPANGFRMTRRSANLVRTFVIIRPSEPTPTFVNKRPHLGRVAGALNDRLWVRALQRGSSKYHWLSYLHELYRPSGIWRR